MVFIENQRILSIIKGVGKIAPACGKIGPVYGTSERCVIYRFKDNFVYIQDLTIFQIFESATYDSFCQIGSQMLKFVFYHLNLQYTFYIPIE